jgi:Domain of unkown function (DUF1775)
VYRTCARIAAAGVAALALIAVAAPALAHTQATIDNPQAGATNVVLSLNAEAESTTAGIKSLDVTLPDGITPAQVSLVTGPNGWTFARTDRGFTLAGTALPVGTAAKASLRIAQLPATATLLAFKTLVTYNDGKVDRWIEVPSSAAPSPPNPAATVSLKPAASPTATGAPTNTLVSPGAVARGAASPADTAPTSKSDTTLLWVIVGAGLVLLVLIGVLLWRRRTRLHTND